MIRYKLYQLIKKIPKPLQIYIRWLYVKWYRDAHTRKHRKAIIQQWANAGKPLPPPHVIKQQVVENYQAMYRYTVLVETGTYLGEMVHAQKDNFKEIYSVELSKSLFELAKKRFKKHAHITIIHGDSGQKLKEIMDVINEPAIFWLDGHYSAGVTAKGDLECPIFQEIDQIFKKDLKHVILIDDARCFTGKQDYPTIEQLSLFMKTKNDLYKVKVDNDIIQYYIEQ